MDGKPCGKPGTGPDAALLGQLICAAGATGLGNCRAGSHYPKQTRIVMPPLPKLPSMPDPCRGVPRNMFCGPRN